MATATTKGEPGMGAYTVIGVLAVVVLFSLLAVRATDLFSISVRDGEVLPLRGQVPPALLGELSEVVARAGVARGSIVARRRGGAARLSLRGFEPGVEQRLRNVFGSRGGAELKLSLAPGPRPPRNLGQHLGWPWLAWYLKGQQRERG